MTMLFIMGVLLVFTALALIGNAMRNAAPSSGVVPCGSTIASPVMVRPSTSIQSGPT